MPKDFGRKLLGVVCAFTFFTTTSWAQNYPNRAIRLITPISAGSVTDVAARVMAQELSEHMGVPVIVDNKPGGAMVIGGAECAKSAPDGYSLCLINPDTVSFNPFIIKNLPYDPDRDFKPVTNMYNVVEGLVAKQSLPANSIAELSAIAAKEPGKLNFGTFGARSISDMYRQWLGEQWKTEFAGVPFKGGSEIINALIGGTIDLSEIGIGNLAGQLESGQAKVLALRTQKRHSLLPQVPTMEEAGLAPFPGGLVFWGIVVPSATPDDITERIYREVTAVIRGPKFTDFARSHFLDPDGSTQEQFAAFLKQDRVRARKLLDRYAPDN